MEAIRKITKIKNNSLQLANLRSFNNQMVEVLIFPVSIRKEDQKVKAKKPAKKANTSFFKLKGIWKDKDIDLKSLREKAWPERKKNFN